MEGGQQSRRCGREALSLTGECSLAVVQARDHSDEAHFDQGLSWWRMLGMLGIGACVEGSGEYAQGAR